MNICQYKEIENYMLSMMDDSAHDKEHVYRVLYLSLDIAEREENVNFDVLIAACLLHDIGRKEQLSDPSLCHARIGSEKAYNFLLEKGYGEEFSCRVRSAVLPHRFRSSCSPESIEAKILFDADKIDVTGAMGIARTLVYKGGLEEPLYTLKENGEVSDGTGDTAPSFFQEYKFKLEKLYDRFYTERGKAIAKERQKTAIDFYERMLKEVKEPYENGMEFLKNKIEA